MKRFFLLCALCCSLSLVAQGLRQSVCVVYPQYSSEDSTILASYADAYHRAGLTSRADALNSYAEGTFGSGVVVEQDNNLYVLTNRHVVGYAAEAKIVFMLKGKNLTYEHCPVYSSCAQADLAVVQLPETVGIDCAPLSFEQQDVQEGEDIYAVGFPGLGGKASWQLSRGEVSNSSLEIEEGGLSYIQHTAPIDPGSSGGPLLRKTDNTYGLLGINTLKASYRDRVGIAIGMTDIRAFMQTLHTPDTTDRQQLHALRPYDAGRWHEYYEQLAQTKRDSLKKAYYVLPLDFALAVYEEYDVVPMSDTEAQEAVLTNDKFGVEHRSDHSFGVIVGYDCFFNGNNNFTVAFGFYGIYVLQEIRLTTPWYKGDPSGPVNVTGIMAGYAVGAQLPLRINRRHKMIPYAKVGVQGGLALTPYTSSVEADFLLGPSLRTGVDYRLIAGKVAVIVGVEYVFQPTICTHNLSIPNTASMLYLQNGLGVRLGVGF